MSNETCQALLAAVEYIDEATVRGFAIDLCRYEHLQAGENLALFSWVLKNPAKLSMLRSMWKQEQTLEKIRLLTRN